MLASELWYQVASECVPKFDSLRLSYCYFSVTTSVISFSKVSSKIITQREKKDSIEKWFTLVLASKCRQFQKSKSSFTIDFSHILNSYFSASTGLNTLSKVSIERIRFMLQHGVFLKKVIRFKSFLKTLMIRRFRMCFIFWFNSLFNFIFLYFSITTDGFFSVQVPMEQITPVASFGFRSHVLHSLKRNFWSPKHPNDLLVWTHDEIQTLFFRHYQPSFFHQLLNDHACSRKGTPSQQNHWLFFVVLEFW